VVTNVEPENAFKRRRRGEKARQKGRVNAVWQT
jgi:hypothetical protein